MEDLHFVHAGSLNKSTRQGSRDMSCSNYGHTCISPHLPPVDVLYVSCLQNWIVDPHIDHAAVVSRNNNGFNPLDHFRVGLAIRTDSESCNLVARMMLYDFRVERLSTEKQKDLNGALGKQL